MDYDDANRDLATTCPYCGKKNTKSVNPGGAWPVSGDVAVCISCQKPSVYMITAMGIALRLPTEEEAADIAANPQLGRIRDALRSTGSVRDAFKVWRDNSGPEE